MALDASFRSRLKEALQQSAAGRAKESVPVRDLQYETEEDRQFRVDAEQSAWIADQLGGWWQRDAGGTCLIVDRDYPADRIHGEAQIGEYAETLERCHRSLRTFDRRAAQEEQRGLFTVETVETPPPLDDNRFLFFDLETTGLSGGAGTCAFLIGYGWFEATRFHTRQYFLTGFGHEAAMLRMASAALETPSTLATYNGKTFDVPLIAGRYLFHRVPSPFDLVAHVDLLHPARRLWRYRPADQRPPGDERREAFERYFRATELRDQFRRRHDPSVGGAGCTLGDLEQAVLGYRRTGDVPGGEIPTRYFHYVRSGDVRPLAPVLEHNRLDLVSLAAVASVVARMLEEGPSAARNAHECLALGRLYERAGAADRATVCYATAVDGHEVATWQGDPTVQREALRRLAMRHRRERRYEAAADAWQRLLDLASADEGVQFQALHALAIHHEHRSGDLQAARSLVLRALERTNQSRVQQALSHRLARIDRKLARRAGGAAARPVDS